MLQTPVANDPRLFLSGRKELALFAKLLACGVGAGVRLNYFDSHLSHLKNS